ncbi:Thioredoxin reductase [Actinomycetales bacterium JB111]|nr:Thioredoxin reductase [Actinomycetales bacterium JB111]
MQTTTYDVVIAGGGAAGLSAALMLGRSRRSVLVVDSGSPRNRFADHMHGVLGNEGVSPLDLLRTGRQETAQYGVSFAPGRVTRVEEARADSAHTDAAPASADAAPASAEAVSAAPAAPPDAPAVDGVPPELVVHLSDGRRVTTRALVAATGISDELPDIPGLAERWGRTVLHCPYCHGWEVRDRRLGVLATSPQSLHQAEMIRQWSPDVTVFSAELGALAPQTSHRLRSRGVVLEPSPVAEVRGEGEAISVVVLEDGREVAVDAIFTAGSPVPHDSYLADLGLDRTEGPFGSFLSVDFSGRTSHPRIWAAGNVVSPMANVPITIGAGAMAGAAVNGALIGWEFDAASPVQTEWPESTSAEDWEKRYADSDGVWSGSPNRVLADVAAGLEAGTALDVGCGEGADAVWLASRGWRATGLDVSATAVGRAARAAAERGIAPEDARFVAGGLAALDGESFDLVTVSFLHSPAGAPREDVLRGAADRVASGGHLLVTSHFSMPTPQGGSGEGAGHAAEEDPGHAAEHAAEHAAGHGGHDHGGRRFLSPDEELEALALPTGEWTTVAAELRPREVTMPNGSSATLEDSVLLLRRA